MKVCGIDPGSLGCYSKAYKAGKIKEGQYKTNGALVFFDGTSLEIYRVPNTPEELALIFKKEKPDYVVTETVSSMPGQGSRSSFSFGAGSGHLWQAAVSSGAKAECVLPNTWIKELNVSKGRVNKGKRKKEIISLAKEWVSELGFDFKIFGWNGDAVMICKYAWEKYY